MKKKESRLNMKKSLGKTLGMGTLGLALIAGVSSPLHGLRAAESEETISSSRFSVAGDAISRLFSNHDYVIEAADDSRYVGMKFSLESSLSNILGDASKRHAKSAYSGMFPYRIKVELVKSKNDGANVGDDDQELKARIKEATVAAVRGLIEEPGIGSVGFAFLEGTYQADHEVLGDNTFLKVVSLDVNLDAPIFDTIFNIRSNGHLTMGPGGANLSDSRCADGLCPDGGVRTEANVSGGIGVGTRTERNILIGELVYDQTSLKSVQKRWAGPEGDIYAKRYSVENDFKMNYFGQRVALRIPQVPGLRIVIENGTYKSDYDISIDPFYQRRGDYDGREDSRIGTKETEERIQKVGVEYRF